MNNFAHVSAETIADQSRHAALLRTLEAKRRKLSVVVPTDDNEVRVRLRAMGHPVRLFGEREMQRRDRLREILAKQEIDAEEMAKIRKIQDDIRGRGGAKASHETSSIGEAAKVPSQQKNMRVVGGNNVVFYTPPAGGLIEARKMFAAYSWKEAQQRLKKRRIEKSKLREMHVDSSHASILVVARKLGLSASQLGGRRPLSCVQFSPDNAFVGTGSWSSESAVWDAASCAKRCVLVGHQERVGDIKFHPSYGKSSHLLATCAADSTAMLWKWRPSNAEKNISRVNPFATLLGHAQRVCKLAWHPSGGHIATTSFDRTVRLWDVETSQEILLQEGHAERTYGVAFQCDGALMATTDLAGCGRVWDIRSGKSVFSILGHAGLLLTADFSPDGYRLATAGTDHCAKIWDLRKRKEAYTLLAHSNIVSTAMFSPASGSLFMTSSFDATVRVWSARNWMPVKCLRGHADKIFAAHMSSDERRIVTASYDKTWKVWDCC